MRFPDAAVPFPDGLIEQLPPRGDDYVAWFHYAQRLLATTDDYSWEVVALTYAEDGGPDGPLWVCRGRLTVVNGMPKDGVGVGDTPKNAESDAFKRAASKWGYGLHLWAGKDYWLEAQLEKTGGAHPSQTQYARGQWQDGKELGKDAGG